MAPRIASLRSDTGVVLIGNVVSRGLGFLFPVVLAHAITRQDFGTVYFFIGTGFFVGELVLTGFPTAMTRFVASGGPRAGWVPSALVGGIPLLALSLLLGELLARATGQPAGPMSVVIVGLTIDAYYFGLLRGLGDFKLLALYRVSANLAQIALLLGAAAAGIVSLEVAIAIYSFVYLIPIAAIELARRPLWGALRHAARPDRGQISELARFAVPALLSGTAYAGLTQADVLIVELLSPESLAEYAAAFSLAQPMMFVPYAIAIVLMPRVAAATEDQRWAMLVRALRATLVLALALLAPYLLMSGWIVELALPAGYGDAAGALPLIALALAGMGACTVLSQWWMGRGRPLVPAIGMSIGALTAVGLQCLLTPAHGAVGAAVALDGGVFTALLVLGAQTLHGRSSARSAAASTPTHV